MDVVLAALEDAAGDPEARVNLVTILARTAVASPALLAPRVEVAIAGAAQAVRKAAADHRLVTEFGHLVSAVFAAAAAAAAGRGRNGAEHDGAGDDDALLAMVVEVGLVTLLGDALADRAPVAVAGASGAVEFNEELHAAVVSLVGAMRSLAAHPARVCALMDDPVRGLLALLPTEPGAIDWAPRYAPLFSQACAAVGDLVRSPSEWEAALAGDGAAAGGLNRLVAAALCIFGDGDVPTGDSRRQRRLGDAFKASLAVLVARLARAVGRPARDALGPPIIAVLVGATDRLGSDSPARRLLFDAMWALADGGHTGNTVLLREAGGVALVDGFFQAQAGLGARFVWTPVARLFLHLVVMDDVLEVCTPELTATLVGLLALFERDLSFARAALAVFTEVAPDRFCMQVLVGAGLVPIAQRIAHHFAVERDVLRLATGLVARVHRAAVEAAKQAALDAADVPNRPRRAVSVISPGAMRTSTSAGNLPSYRSEGGTRAGGRAPGLPTSPSAPLDLSGQAGSDPMSFSGSGPVYPHPDMAPTGADRYGRSGRQRSASTNARPRTGVIMIT